MTPSQTTPPPPWGPLGEGGSCRPGADDGGSVAPSRPSRKPLTRRLSKGIVSCSYIVGWLRNLGLLGTRRNRSSFRLPGVVAPRGCRLHSTDTHAGALGWGSISVVFFPGPAGHPCSIPMCDIPFPPRSGGIQWKGMISARPLYQGGTRSAWDPKTSTCRKLRPQGWRHGP